MNSPKTPKNPNPSDDLASQLKHLGLVLTAHTLDDLLARASTQRWSPRQLLQEVARAESEDRARRSLERRLAQARLGRFKPLGLRLALAPEDRPPLDRTRLDAGLPRRGP